MAAPSPWPRRTRICVQCRTALSAGERCTWIRHDLIDLSEPAARGFFIEEVWGSPLELPPRPPLALRLLHAVDDYVVSRRYEGGMRPRDTEVPAIPTGGRYPRGAAEEPLRVTRSAPLAGRIAPDAATAPAPLSGAPCTAYAFQLLDPDADRLPVMLRDAASLDATIDLADGRRALLPRGTIDVLARGRRLARSRRGVDAYLAVLDPFAPDDSERPLFRHAEVREALLCPGDQVLVSGDFEPVPDARAGGGGAYREAAATVLRPRGSVLLELPRRRAR